MYRCILATIMFNSFLMYPSVSAEKTVTISAKNCRFLTSHRPHDDVAYKAGVDVRGKAVTPADIAPPRDLGIKDKISFRLILDVAAEYRSGATALTKFKEHPGLKGDLDFGEIIIKDGKVTLDGQDLSAEHQSALYKFCTQRKLLP